MLKNEDGGLACDLPPILRPVRGPSRVPTAPGPNQLDALHGRLGQVQQHHVAGGPLDQGADRGAAVRADDQVTLPVAGTARSSASAGRSLIMTMSRSWPVFSGRRRGAV